MSHEWAEAEDIPFEVRAGTPPPLTEEQAELVARADSNGREPEPAEPRPLLEIRDATIQEFASTEEEGAEPLVGSSRNVLIGQGSDVMFYGDGGAGKTTLMIDLALHLAAGADWLGIPIARPVRVYIVENEGPRPLFRPKLRRKIEAWTGPPLDDRIHVLEEPWASFSFADPAWREAIAGRVRELEIDVNMVGPLTASGMDLPGTIQECRAFLDLVDEVRALAGRPFANLIAHHKNQGGKVSGAWRGVGDGLFEVRGRGHGRTDLYFEKARWSNEHHGKTLELGWADGESFTVNEEPKPDDEQLAEMIRDYVRENPGTGWSKVAESIKGARRKTKVQVRDGLIAAGELVNVGKDEGGQDVQQEIEERKTTRLYLADEPLIAQLRPASGADGAQTAIDDDDIPF